MKKSLLSLLAVFACATVANAETYTINTNSSASTWTGDDNGFSTTVDGWELKYEKNKSTNNCVEPKSDHIRVYKNAKFSVSATEAIKDPIVKLVINCTGNQYCSTPTASAGSVNSEGTTITWTGNANSLSFETTAQVRIKNIEITTASAGEITAPAITPNGGEYVEGDAVDITISGSTGLDLYYAFSDDFSKATKYTETFYIKENATVYAWASDGTNNSKSTSAKFNFSAPRKNVAAFYELKKGNAAMFTGALTVVYQNGINLIVKDESGAMLVYGKVSQTYNNGDVIAAGVRGSVTIYGKNHQLTPQDDSFAAGIAGEAVEAKAVAVEDLKSCNYLDFVKVSGVSCSLDAGKTKNYTISNGTTTFAVYNQFNLEMPELDANKKYDIVGFVSSYNGNAQFQPISVVENSSSAIDEIGVDENAPVEFFNLQGVRVENPENGIFVRRQGGKVSKVVIR